MASTRTVGEFFPKYRGPGRGVLVSEITTLRDRDPKLWRTLYLACVRTQFDILCEVWKDHCHFTEEVHGAFRAIVNCGYFVDALNVESAESRKVFRLAIEGYAQGAKAQRLARAS
jgi:hypothetical protein